MHVASTGWLFTDIDVLRIAANRRVRYLWTPMALVTLATVTAAVLPPGTFAVPLLAFFAWQLFHYQKQNVGMAALVGAAYRVAPLQVWERRAVILAGAGGTLALTGSPGLLQLSGLWSTVPSLVLGGRLIFLLGIGGGMMAVTRRPPAARPACFLSCYLAALLFPLPIFVFRTPYQAVGGLTLAHGLQYLFLQVSLGVAEHPRSTRAVRLSILVIVAVAGGEVLNATSHLHSSRPALRLLFGGYVGLVMAHFVVDAGIWRLSDPRCRAWIGIRLPFLFAASPLAPYPDGSVDVIV